MFFLIRLYFLRQLPVGQRRGSVFFPEDPGEIGLVVEAAVLRNVDYFEAGLRQLPGSQLQAVVDQIGVKAGSRKFPE